jgi:NitT/TauT family transport system permease protein
MSAQPSSKAVKRRGRIGDYLVIAAVTAVLLVIWEAAVRFWQIPQFVLPPPSAVLDRLATDLIDGVMIGHFVTTLVEVVAGFALAVALGVGLGCAIGLVPVVERIVYPYVLAL